jgi:integrase
VRQKSGKWLADWRDERGRRHRKAFLSKSQANRYQQRKRMEAEAKKTPRLGTMGDFAEAWMSSRKNCDRDHTVAREMRLKWRDIPPENLLPAQVIDLVDEWKKIYARSTVVGRRDTLKRLLTFVDRTHRTYLAEAVPRVPPGEQRHVTATNEEVAKLLSAAPTWMRALILFARVLGLRRGEIINLTPKNFDQQTKGLNFLRKGGGTSGLPVPPELERIIQFAGEQDPNERIIVTLGMRRPCERKSVHVKQQSQEAREWTAFNSLISNSWTSLKKRAGVNPDLHIHDLRHTAATEAFTETKDLRTVQQLLGHRSLSSTMRYLAPLKTEELREQLKELNHAWLYRARPATELKQ